ncbi:alpha/beta hydrolase, partial [Reichenbachiella sp.]
MENCSLDQWYDPAKKFEWKGHSIRYKEHQAEDETLLLIHGFPTASYDWCKIWKPLTERFSLIAPDMIGFGYSDKPYNFPYSIMKQANMILDLLSNKGVTSFHILAHDYGDTVAQEILARTNYDPKFDV